jgi:hypothetical protein
MTAAMPPPESQEALGKSALQAPPVYDCVGPGPGAHLRQTGSPGRLEV